MSTHKVIVGNPWAYYQRRKMVLERVRVRGAAGVFCVDVAAMLGWPVAEVRGKLQSLRSDGLVVYDGAKWRAVT